MKAELNILPYPQGGVLLRTRGLKKVLIGFYGSTLVLLLSVSTMPYAQTFSSDLSGGVPGPVSNAYEASAKISKDQRTCSSLHLGF